MLKRTFNAFKYPDFRLMWLGACVSTIGTWMQILAQSWLVYQLSKSSLYLGLDAFFGQIPIFPLSLFGGVFADRKSRRGMLITSQVIQMACAFILATLVCVACTSAKIRNPPQGVTNTTAANIQRESARSVPSKSPIRSIDFNNFTYPAKPIYRRGQTTFTLTNGHYEGRVRMTGGTGPFGDPYPISLVDVVYEDITARKQTEEQLRETEEHYRRIFESTSDGLIINDPQTGRVVGANPAICAMHGYSHEEFIGIHATEFIHPDFHHVFTDFVETIAAGGDQPPIARTNASTTPGSNWLPASSRSTARACSGSSAGRCGRRDVSAS